MKRIFIHVKNSIHQPYEVDISPGTTPSEILVSLHLEEEYDLYRLADPTTYFSEEDLYPLVTQGEQLLAQTIFEADEAFMEHRAYGKGEL